MVRSQSSKRLSQRKFCSRRGTLTLLAPAVLSGVAALLAQHADASTLYYTTAPGALAQGAGTWDTGVSSTNDYWGTGTTNTSLTTWTQGDTAAFQTGGTDTVTVADGAAVDANGITIATGTTVNIAPTGDSNPQGTLEVDGGGITASNTANSISANVVLGASQTWNVGTSSLSVSGAISDLNPASPGTLVKAGAGYLYLTGANSYGGGTSLQAGYLDVGNNSALGTGALTATSGTLSDSVAAGSVVDLANNIVLGANGTLGLSYSSGTGAITLAGNISSSVQTLSAGGTISAPNLAGGIYLGGNNSGYYGTFDVGKGLYLTSLNSGSANSVWGNYAGTYDVIYLDAPTGGTVYLGGLSGTTYGNDGIQPMGSTNSYTLQIGGANQAETTNAIISGKIALVMNGTGSQGFTAANTYSNGTTITNGSLFASNTSGSATGTGAVGVNGGALAGTGIVTGLVTVNSSGAVAPGGTAGGANTGGMLTLNGGLTLNNGSNANFDIDTTPGGSNNDLISLGTAGVLSLSGSDAVNFTFPDGSPELNTPYTLIDYHSMTGSVSDLVANDVPNGDTAMFSSTGSAIDVTFVPEPASAAVALGAWAFLLMGRRRKRAV